MTDFLPTQEPGPGPTDAPLATWQSYSAYTTDIYEYTSTITRVAYNPAGTEAPSIDIETETAKTTSIAYTVVNRPLLYTGPFPAPPLGTLFTTHGQVLRPTRTASATSPAQTTAPSAASGSSNGNSQGSNPSQPISASSPVATASPRPSQQNAGSNAAGNNQQGGEASSAGSGTGTNQNNGSSGNQSVNQGGNGTGNQNTQQQGSSSTPTAGSNNGQGGSNSGGSSNSDTNTASNPAATPAPQSSTTSSFPLNNSNASAGSIIASQGSVSASNAAASASNASVNASNAAQSSSASAQSASAASAASSASALSASASSQSASAASSISFSSASPTSTLGGLSPSDLSSHGLSGGEIAGIVLGSIFGLLLLLLLLGLLLARRRREAARNGTGAESGRDGNGIGRKLGDKWASGFSKTGAGDYAALGAGAGLAGLGMAAAGGRGPHSSNNNEWEEDRLSGGDGSGFFVVGGKRQGGRGSAGGPFGSDSDTAVGSLAGFGAGIAAALTGKRKGRNSGKSLEGNHQAVPTSSREADMADEDERAFMSDEDGDPNSEARGLMSFGDIGDSSEMTQSGPSGWTHTPTRGGDGYAGWGTAAAAAAGAGGAVLGAGAMSAARRGKRRNTDDSNDESNWMAGGRSAPSRAAVRQGQQYSPSSYPYQSQPEKSYHDSIASPRSSRTERVPSFSGTFGDGDLSTTSPFDEEALLGAGAAGVGLAALAAGHRASGHSQVGSEYGPDDSHSSFLSQDTPLLGPGAYQSRDQTRPTGTLGTAYSHQNRLPTIRSVGEFGERGSSLAPSTGRSGTRGTGSGSGTGTGSSSGFGYGSGRSVPLYATSAGPSAAGLQQFYTPTESPGMNLDPFQDRSQLASIPDDHRGEDVASTTALGSVAGFLGGLLPNLGGWTKSEDTDYDPLVDDHARESIRPLATGQKRGQENDTAETRSQRASVYDNGSKIGHKQPSPTGSAQSSVPNSAPSRNSPDETEVEQPEGVTFDGDATTDAYTASVSTQSRDISSGNSRSDSRRSGQTMSTRFTRGTNSESNSNSQNNSGTSSNRRRNEDSSTGSGSTGAASYNPSYLARQTTSSTRGAGNSSGSSQLASRGGNTSSSSSRRRRREDATAQTLDSDGRSSRATAGDGEDLPRVSFDPGLEDVQEGSTEGALLPSGNYYPSESLGAAVRRQAERDQQDDAVLYPEMTMPSVAPLSWRQSPRVESVSQRANANLMQQRPSSLYDSFTQMHGAGSPPPRPPPRRSRLSEIESEASQNERHNATREEEGDDSNRLWI